MQDRSLIVAGEVLPMHLLLANKSVFVFDWDGTILDSMPYKAKNFGKAFGLTFPDAHEQGLAARVEDCYLQLSGHPRKRIFNQILSTLGINTVEDKFLQFNSFFEELNKVTLINARIFPDAIALLEDLVVRGRSIFISSSVPPRELSELVELVLPAALMSGVTSVFGSSDGFSKGNGHIREIMRVTGATQKQLIFFGDDLADYELSTEAGIDCILVNRTGRLPRLGKTMVSNLFEVKDGLSK